MGPSDRDQDHPYGGASHGENGPLEGDNRWLRSVLENSSEIVKVVDPDGTLRYASPAFGRALGYDPEEARGTSVFDHVHPDDLAHVLEATEEALSAGSVTTNVVEYRFRHRDGTWRWMEAVGTYLPDDPAVRGVVINARDVTERKEAERALEESERRFSSVVSDAHAYVYRCRNEPGWPNEYASDYALELTGYPPEDLLVGGKVQIGDLIVEEDRGRVWEEVQRALAEGRGFELTYAIRRRDGRVRHVHEYGRGVYREDGEAVALEGLVYDVTERREAEEALRKAEERYRTLVEHLPAVTFIDRAKGSEEPVYVSPQVEGMLGYTPHEWMAGRLWRARLHPEDRERILASDERFGAHGGRVDEEYRLLAKDGSVVWVREETTLARGEGGEPLYVQGIVSDITERKRAEEGLRLRDRAMEASSDGIVITDPKAPDDPIVYVNPAFERITGYPAEEVLGRNCRFLQNDDRDQPVLEALQEAMREGCGFRGVLRNYRKDGTLFFNELHVAPVRDGAGRLVNFVGIQTDVTGRKEAEESLRRSEASLSEAQRLAHLGSWAWDVETGEAWWSDETYRIYGFRPGEAVPTLAKLMEVVHPDDRGSLGAAIDDALRENRPYDLEHRVVRPSGEVRVVHRRAEVVRGDRGGPSRMVGTVHDVTERKALEGRLRYQALHDPLTGLPNRQLLVDRLQQALRRTKRRKDRRVAVLFMDLDGFKVVNDSLGHELGDRLLTAVAERLEGCLRPEDALARFGGDEFVVLLEDVHGPDEAVRVARRIIQGLREPFLLGGRELYAAASIGVALGSERTKDCHDLLRDADTAMYRAKESGTGYSVFDPAMHGRVLHRLEVEHDLRRAIEEDEFVVHYQPIVDLQTGAVRGVEALVRWEHPERGLLNPDEFVPAAEESGLVVPMGEAVLGEACLRAKQWQEEHPRIPPLAMSVNLSARQLARPDLAKIVERALGESGLEARCLVLDVTETVYVKALEGNTAALDGLRAMGVGVSIDDFGTGYSSLAYLKRLPADALKIDKSFVGGLGEDAEDTAIVQMVVELAHTLGMEAIAEGVETEEQADLLGGMGCDFGQGYHFSKPLSPEQAPRFLKG